MDPGFSIYLQEGGGGGMGAPHSRVRRLLPAAPAESIQYTPSYFAFYEIQLKGNILVETLSSPFLELPSFFPYPFQYPSFLSSRTPRAPLPPLVRACVLIGKELNFLKCSPTLGRSIGPGCPHFLSRVKKPLPSRHHTKHSVP